MYGDVPVNQSPDQVDQLSAQQKRALLAELLQKRSSQPKDRPLSAGQERLYRLVRLNPHVPLYNVAVTYRLSGPLNVKAMERAVRQIQERHEILRTTFPPVDGEPIQRIATAQTRSDIFVTIDLSTAPQVNQSERVGRVIQSEITRAIDLALGPLWRVALIRVSEREHILVLTMHHIVSDGWSFDLFLREFGALYRSFDSGSVSSLDKLSIQYCEYAERQREFFADAAFERQRRYWVDQLAGPISPLRLPTDCVRSSGDSRAAVSFPFALPSELSQALVNLTQRESATLFMTLLTGFAALLHGSTHQEDLLLCTPVTGRHRPQSKDLIGYFNNILPMRLDLSGDPSLLGLLRSTRRVALDAFNNQDVPFHRIADLPALRRISLSRLLFSFDMEWPPRLELTQLNCEPVAVDTGTADFDLSVSLWTSHGQIFGNLRYKQELFEERTIANLSESYHTLLTILADEPERTLSSLPRFVPAREQDRRPAVVIEHREADNPVLNWPRSAIEMQLVREWEDELDQRPIGIHDDLQSLGASSLAVASLALRIQDVFHTTVPVTEIFQAGTIERMAALLQSRDKSLSASPLAPIQRNGTKPPLFLCEGVGIYFPLVPYLGEDQPIYGLATEIRASFPGVAALAAHYVTAVLESQPTGPYYLGGISFGGLVAFEMAQQLHAMGHKIGLLALMETPGPGAYRFKPPIQRAAGHVKNSHAVWISLLDGQVGKTSE